MKPDQLNFSMNGLLPVVVQHQRSGQVLMVGFANREAVDKTVETGRAWFFSRSRQRLWEKGETSGHVLEVNPAHAVRGPKHVVKRGKTIAKVTQSRYMPPWHAERGFGDFADERHLTDDQIATIAEWVNQGMPPGEASKMPKLPVFTDGWQLGTPDLVVEMPEAFDVPASGPDVYRNFAIPLGFTEDKWVRAVEYRPSNRGFR